MFYGGLELVVLPLAVLGVVVLAIVALAGARGEPDTRGERAHALYVALVSFVAIFTLLFALTQVAESVAEMVIDPEIDCSEGFAPECYEEVSLGTPPTAIDVPDQTERRTRDALNAAAVALVAGAVLWFHRRRSDDLGELGPVPARTFNAYLYAVSFTAMLVLLVVGAIVLFTLVRVAVPDAVSTASSGTERDNALVDLAPSLTGVAGAALIYVRHWRAAGRLRRGEPPPE